LIQNSKKKKHSFNAKIYYCKNISNYLHELNYFCFGFFFSYRGEELLFEAHWIILEKGLERSTTLACWGKSLRRRKGRSTETVIIANKGARGWRAYQER
jgi:hypothetical protein